MNKEDDLKKEAYKLAMKEFLEEQKKQTFESIGKWVSTVFSTLLAGSLLWLMLKSSGWSHQ
jgi:hypothetical protein